MTTVFEEAEQIVNGDRQNDYGHPADNHERTALLWNAYLEAKQVGLPKGFIVELGPEDVCWLNVLQKIARQLNASKRDNLIDSAGYIRNIEMMS